MIPRESRQRYSAVCWALLFWLSVVSVLAASAIPKTACELGNAPGASWRLSQTRTSARSVGRGWRRVVPPRDHQRPGLEHGSGLVAVVSRSAPRFERQREADAPERQANEV
jgi:hypothetical protein